MSIVLVRKVSLPEDDPIILAADRMAPRIRQAFLDAIDAVRSQVTVRRIADAVEQGDAGRVMELLNVQGRLSAAFGGAGLSASVSNVRSALQDTFRAGAQAALESLPSRIGTDLAFNLLNPEAVRFLDSYTFDLIQQVTQETRDAIQAIIIRSFREGGSPLEQARQIRDVIGLTARQEVAVDNFRNALSSGMSSDLRTALDRSLRDGRYDRTLLSALRNDRPLAQAQIDRMVERYRQRYLQYRARTIARTESIRASNKGQRELWRQAVHQGLIPGTARRKWIVSGDERTCAICLDLEDEERGLDEEFAPGIMEPPDPHPDCRCSLGLVAASLRRAA